MPCNLTACPNKIQHTLKEDNKIHYSKMWYLQKTTTPFHNTFFLKKSLSANTEGTFLNLIKVFMKNWHQASYLINGARLNTFSLKTETR